MLTEMHNYNSFLSKNFSALSRDSGPRQFNMWKLAVLCAVTTAVEFDTNDPMVSHPEMQSLVNSIVERNARRGLTNPATLSQTDRDDILALHNKVRAETGNCPHTQTVVYCEFAQYTATCKSCCVLLIDYVARGEYTGSGTMLPQATNMNYLKWSSTLETVATEWSSYCNFNHRSGTSSCSNAMNSLSVDMDGYSSGDGCGENLYGSGASPVWSQIWNGDDYGIRGGIEDNWCVDEAATWTYSTSTGSAGHYTQVVWANTQYVGCGFYNCDSANGWMNNMFTCK